MGKLRSHSKEEAEDLNPGLSDMKAHILIRLATTYIIRNNNSLTSALNTGLECFKFQVVKSSQTTKLLKNIGWEKGSSVFFYYILELWIL